MEERERSRERVSESNGEERLLRGANGDAAILVQSGARKSSFGVESKTFEVETEKKKGKMQIFIVERKRGVSSWIKLGLASLGPLLEGLVFWTKDTRIGHWEKLRGDASSVWVLSIRKRKDLVSLYPKVEEQKGVGLFCWRRYERWMLLPKGK